MLFVDALFDYSGDVKLVMTVPGSERTTSSPFSTVSTAASAMGGRPDSEQAIAVVAPKALTFTDRFDDPGDHVPEIWLQPSEPVRLPVFQANFDEETPPAGPTRPLCPWCGRA